MFMEIHVDSYYIVCMNLHVLGPALFFSGSHHIIIASITCNFSIHNFISSISTQLVEVVAFDSFAFCFYVYICNKTERNIFIFSKPEFFVLLIYSIVIFKHSFMFSLSFLSLSLPRARIDAQTRTLVAQ